MKYLKYLASLLLVVVMVAAITGAASAQNTGDRYWADWSYTGAGGYTTGDKTFTQLGFIKAAAYPTIDYSTVTTDGGNKVWSINDTSNASTGQMKMYKDGISANGGNVSNGGMIMSKLKFIADTSSGTIGFTNASNNISAMICLRPTGINLKTASASQKSDLAYTGHAAGAVWDTPGETTDYHVYAMRWRVGQIPGNTSPEVMIWVTNGSDWSSNSADWTALNNGNWIGFTTGGVAFQDPSGTPVAGVMVGTWGSSSVLNFNMEYIAHQHLYANPWEYNPAYVPEPGSMLALASGLVAMAGFAIRRRRA
jgi:hypothetical protein